MEAGFSRLDTDTAVGNLRARHFYEENVFSGRESPEAVTGIFQNEKTRERGEKINCCLELTIDN